MAAAPTDVRELPVLSEVDLEGAAVFSSLEVRADHIVLRQLTEHQAQEKSSTAAPATRTLSHANFIGLSQDKKGALVLHALVPTPKPPPGACT